MLECFLDFSPEQNQRVGRYEGWFLLELTCRLDKGPSLLPLRPRPSATTPVRHASRRVALPCQCIWKSFLCHVLCKFYIHTVMHCLARWTCSETCMVRWCRPCANTIECTRPKPGGGAGCFTVCAVLLQARSTAALPPPASPQTPEGCSALPCCVDDNVTRQ